MMTDNMERTKIATFFREAFQIETMSPEEYAARYSHELTCFGLPFSVHRDPELEEWTQKLSRIIYEDGLVEKLRKIYLTAEEIREINRIEGRSDIF